MTAPNPDRRPDEAARQDFLYSEDELHKINVRGKARGLTKLCVACEELGRCTVGRQLAQLHRRFCEPEVGGDFHHCSQCSRTLAGCAVDEAALDAQLHDQLAYCTRKRGFEMPFRLMRWDVLFGSR